MELHSALLKNPRQLTGRDAVVVSGGASADDLLNLCFNRLARRRMWVHRALRWMVPTRKPKHQAGGIRARMIGNFNQIDRYTAAKCCPRRDDRSSYATGSRSRQT